MRRPVLIAAGLLAAAAIALTFASEALAQGKCDASTLSATLHDKMKADGMNDAAIRDVLGSSVKRRALRGRVANGSGCTADQVDSALKQLDTAVKG
ncbi:MAG: hypothetical protein J0H82_07740 [Alphaproteobacteria bacterium]|jgi:hypothetical protein|nr:hypothetical protein [Alphaproteobacteria bacterium]